MNKMIIHIFKRLWISFSIATFLPTIGWYLLSHKSILADDHFLLGGPVGLLILFPMLTYSIFEYQGKSKIAKYCYFSIVGIIFIIALVLFIVIKEEGFEGIFLIYAISLVVGALIIYIVLKKIKNENILFIICSLWGLSFVVLYFYTTIIYWV